MGDDVEVAADKQRGKQTVRDMLISLAVILLAAWVMYLFIPHDEDQDPVRPVSYRVELDSARRAAPYPVAAPVGLPDGWRATSVTFQGDGSGAADWHLGFLSPEDEYAAVEQSDAERPAKFIRDVTQGAEKSERTQQVEGDAWVRYQGEKYDALVRTDEEQAVTTVVTGTAGFAELGELAGALQEKRGSSGSSPSATP